ncbi:hypothetical protein [Parvularcula sp. LCG005]|uniref:hypothetical protein n=1 Tax=Parvularcula sp. LCG005 TaxID=3078805 RepID=UPI0029427973|nr:hypothetical protein [Parvularcula sp. LCG005]WOI53001.1 hypothetical protein RUI03_12670 [Parvularcula sp. LCG005]
MLNALEGLVVDQAFVAAFPKPNIPTGDLDIACVKRAREDVGDTLDADLAGRAVFGKAWLFFQKAFHFRLGFKAARGKAFESFLDD